MKKNLFVLTGIGLGFLLAFQVFPALAQKSSKSLTFLYSNNVNGEIDPCPT